MTIWNLETQVGDYFGLSDYYYTENVPVSLSADGNVLAVGVSGKDSSKGAVFIYEKNAGGDWPTTPTQQLLNSSGSPGDRSGYSVSLSADGNVLAVGVPGKDSGKGAVFIYERVVGGTWPTTPTQQLVNSSGAADDVAGHSVSLSAYGNTLAVGVPLKNDGLFKGHVGAVFVYERAANNGSWSATPSLTQLINTLGAQGDRSGISVSLSADGNVLAVGLFGRENNRGGVYIYEKTGSGWPSTPTQQLLNSSGSPGDRSGYSVSLSADGNVLAAGVPGKVSSVGTANVGAAFIYERNSGSGSIWTQTQQLVNDLGSPNDEAGNSVSLSADGNTLVVGVPNKDEIDGKQNVGAAYIYERNTGSGTWSSAPTQLINPSGAGNDQGGTYAFLSPNGLVVAIGVRDTDYYDPTKTNGAVFIYSKTMPTPPCFGKGTLILCEAFENYEEDNTNPTKNKYIPVEEIIPGQNVLTLKRFSSPRETVTRKVKEVFHGKMIIDPNDFKRCMYVPRGDKNKDLKIYLTGQHGILISDPEKYLLKNSISITETSGGVEDGEENCLRLIPVAAAKEDFVADFDRFKTGETVDFYHIIVEPLLPTATTDDKKQKQKEEYDFGIIFASEENIPVETMQRKCLTIQNELG